MIPWFCIAIAFPANRCERSPGVAFNSPRRFGHDDRPREDFLGRPPVPLPQTMVMEKMFCKCSGLAWLLLVSATSMTFGQEWSQFRGGQLQGGYERGEAPAMLEDSNLKWSVDLPKGHSSPVVRQGKVFVTSADQDTNTVTTHCFSLETGTPLWHASEKVDEWERIHDFNSHATPTCCCDAEGVLRAQRAVSGEDHLVSAGASPFF